MQIHFIRNVTLIIHTGRIGAKGKHQQPALTIWFRNIDILCRLNALQLSPLRATLTGRAWGWGNLRLGFQIPHLFMQT